MDGHLNIHRRMEFRKHRLPLCGREVEEAYGRWLKRWIRYLFFRKSAFNGRYMPGSGRSAGPRRLAAFSTAILWHEGESPLHKDLGHRSGQAQRRRCFLIVGAP